MSCTRQTTFVQILQCALLIVIMIMTAIGMVYFHRTTPIQPPMVTCPDKPKATGDTSVLFLSPEMFM